MLDHASPRVGSHVSPAPSQVTLTFTEPVVKDGSRIDVTDETGKPVSKGPLRWDAAAPTDIGVALGPLAPGQYKVTSGILCHCGNVTPGTYKFTVD